jgi:hypothetical protein
LNNDPHSIPDSVNTLLHLGRVDHWLALNWETNTDVCIATLKHAYDYYTQVSIEGTPS